MSPLPTIKRPNGTVYRPRKIAAYVWDNTDTSGAFGALVLGTLDLGKAYAVAEKAMRRRFAPDLVATKPLAGWWRITLHWGELAYWRVDLVNGRAGIMFTADIPER
jgi:hypothetical protein